MAARPAAAGLPRQLPSLIQWLTQWVRTGLALDAFTFAFFVAAVLVGGSVIWHRTMADPAARMVGTIMAAHAGSLAFAAEQLPAEDRAAFLDAVTTEGGVIVPGIPDLSPFPDIRNPVAVIARQSFLDAHGYNSTYDEASATLWASVPDGAGSSFWVRVSHAILLEWRSPVGFLAVLATFIAAMLGALGLRLHVRRHAAQDGTLAGGTRPPLAVGPGAGVGMPPGAPAPPATARPFRARRVRRVPPMLLLDVAAILLVLGAVVGSVGWLATRYIVQPRIEFGAQVLGIHVRGLRAVLTVLPEHQRAAVLDNLPRVSRAQLARDDPTRWTTLATGPESFILRQNFKAIARAAPESQWRASPGPSRQLWFTVPGLRGQEAWIRAAVAPEVAWTQPLSRLLLVCAMAGAVWVVLLGRRRARLLADAAARIQGIAGPDGDPADDLSLQARQVLASDARLRELIERRVRDQQDPAREPAPAGAPVVDINELLRGMAEGSTTPFQLQTEGVPYVRIPRQVAAATLRRFIDAMSGPDAGRLVVSTWLDGAAVVVRVANPHAPMDPSRGLSAAEALGEARAMCKAYGGSIQVAALAPAGWQGELRLRVARV